MAMLVMQPIIKGEWQGGEAVVHLSELDMHLLSDMVLVS